MSSFFSSQTTDVFEIWVSYDNDLDAEIATLEVYKPCVIHVHDDTSLKLVGEIKACKRTVNSVGINIDINEVGEPVMTFADACKLNLLALAKSIGVECDFIRFDVEDNREDDGNLFYETLKDFE